MEKRFLLTSLVALGFAGSAMAATRVNTFPDPQAESPAQMLEDRIYTNAADINNMPAGFTFGHGATLYANAVYDEDAYQLVVTKYLPMSSEALAVCVAGNYCPGYDENNNSTVYYSATKNQGIFKCPEGFASSVDGAKSQFQCFRACANTDVMHATSVKSGRNYYGAPADECSPSACEMGWHAAAQENTGISSTALVNAIGSTTGTGWAWVNDNGVWNEGNSGDKGAEYYSMYAVKNGFWAVDYNSQGIVNGMARLSRTGQYTTQMGATEDQLGSQNAGSYCYCKVTGYKPYSKQNDPYADGIQPWQKLTAPWIYAGDNAAGNGICAQRCATYMRTANAYTLPGGGDFRNAMLYSISATTPGQCVVNRYTIHWGDATSASVAANGAGEAIYNRDVRTPKEHDSTKTPAGKRFTGWRFSATEPED